MGGHYDQVYPLFIGILDEGVGRRSRDDFGLDGMPIRRLT